MPNPQKPDQAQPAKKTGKERASAVAAAFNERATKGVGLSDFKIDVSAPHTGNRIVFNKIEAADNVVKVWANGNVGTEPDYVIVNPPIKVQVSATETVEDPLAAIAQAIDGATK